MLNQASLSFVKQNFLSLIRDEASVKAGADLDVVFKIESNNEEIYYVEKQSEVRRKLKKTIFNQ